MGVKTYDWIVVGGGIFGVYAALYLSSRGGRICLIEKESRLLQKASIVNQARVHGGYHYPRSIATARIADEYKLRFIDEHRQFINSSFEHYYGISRCASFTSALAFERFCKYLAIPAEITTKHPAFDTTQFEALYRVEEYAFDPIRLAEHYRQKLASHANVDLYLSSTIEKAEAAGSNWRLTVGGPSGGVMEAPAVLNATYANLNSVNRVFGLPLIPVMHEIVELVMVDVPALQSTALTVMDGYFASIMPYGLQGYHSLSSVFYTPHMVSYKEQPTFPCQTETVPCTPAALDICSECPQRPPTNQRRMTSQIHRYLKPDVELKYLHSMFSVKTKAKANLIDDGRPTIIKRLSSAPDFVCLFAGKINSIYEVERMVSDA